MHKWKKFQCNTCEKELFNEESLRRHVRAFHEKIKDSKSNCKFCDREFCNLNYLEEHVIKEHTEHSENGTQIKLLKTKKLECDQCKKSYFVLGDLKQHISIVHQGIKAYDCDFCNRQFTRKVHMMRHNKLKHLKNTNNIRCQICNKELKGNMQELKNHIMLVHEGKIPDKCDICLKGFRSNEHVRRHKKKVHEKTFS